VAGRQACSKRTGRQLDYVGGAAGKLVVLPVRRAPRRPSNRAEANACEPRVTAPRGDAPAPGSDRRLGLVIPDRHVGPDPADERSGRPRLRFGERCPPGVLGIPGLAGGAPARAEVSVQVDAAGVLTRACSSPVRIQKVHDPDFSAFRQPRPSETSRDRGSGALVAMDAPDDQDRPPGTGATALEGPDRPSEHGDADRLGAREKRRRHRGVSTQHRLILRYGGLEAASPA
jgi:hypothetical protein